MTDAGTAVQTGEAMPLIDALAALPGELERLLQGRSRDALRRPASDGGWGIIEHLCHLRDWNAIYLSRVGTLATENHPTLETYDDELWVIEHHYRDQDPIIVRDELRGDRLMLVEALRLLPRDAWARTGRLGTKDVTIRSLAERLRDHDREHVREITEALA